MDSDTGHSTKSSLSEALQHPGPHPDHSSSPNSMTTPIDITLMPPKSPYDVQHQEGSSVGSEEAATISPRVLNQSRKSGVLEAEKSPFTPDIPVYQLCSPNRTSVSSKSSGLVPVPEEEPASPEALSLSSNRSPSNAGELIEERTSLPQVKTPRRSLNMPAFQDHDFQDHDADMNVSDFESHPVQFLEQERTTSNASTDLPKPSSVFNPFEVDQDFTTPQGTSYTEDALFPIELSGQKSQGLASSGFASISSVTLEPQGLSMPRDTLRQLMDVVENIISQIDNKQKSLDARRTRAHADDAHLTNLQGELDTLRAEEADAEAKLRVMHSQLEAHLLSNLEQEDGLRLSGDMFKGVKEEIQALDQSLSIAEEQRRELQRQLAEAKNRLPPSEATNEIGQEDKTEESPKSNYSSAWETSDSDTEGFEDPGPYMTAPAQSLSEDNRAKMSQQGAQGGKWLKGIPGHRSRKEELPSPIQAEEEDVSTPTGGGMSHFQLPTTAAGLEKPTEEDLASQKSESREIGNS